MDTKRTVWLLRHAKSSWSDGSLDDHDRPLTQRGERAALLVGEYMRQQGIAPAVVLCSTATRARATWELVSERLAGKPHVSFEKELYLCGARALIGRLRELEDRRESVLVVGHNPDLHRLALLLAGSGESEEMANLSGSFPTAGLAGLAFEASTWRDVGPDAGRLTLFVTPKLLV